MTALSSNHAQLMLAMQSQMNSKICTDWVKEDFPYLRAVIIEGAEAIEHHGWKWWKRQQCDIAQLQMEIVDIWHFILSAILIKTKNDQNVAMQLLLSVNDKQLGSNQIEFDGNVYQLSSLNLLAKLELLIGVSVSRRIELDLFSALLKDCQMDWGILFRQYVGKNVLNFFRQDHGYKDGSYHKEWQGKEDNEHLVEVMNHLDSRDPSYPEILYQQLEARYPG
ncbi:MAG: dUTP diphosphatase [Gammaproteobacteria bacterium]|nr:dUTP diphosphatase [Gammaproteobacteria bacterium]